MADEFEDISSRLPDFGSVLAQRAAAAKAGVNSTDPPPGTVDPYKLMMQKKRAMDAGDFDPNTVVRWPEEDEQALKDYCMKLGIYGFNTKLHPRIVLAQLKQQYGDDYSGVPLEERIPAGHEKIGTHSGYGPNYPYSEALRRKQLLHG